MSVFPLGERVLLYVWKVARAVIQLHWAAEGGVCWQDGRGSAGNGPRPAASTAFVCLCLTRRLRVHRRTAWTHPAAEQSGHYRSYLLAALPWLTATRWTNSGWDSEADPKVDWGGSIKGAGDTFSCGQTPTQWQCGTGCQRDGGETECSAGGDKGREGPGITGRWRLKSHGRTSVCSASQTLYTIVKMHPFRCVQIVSFVKSSPAL